MSFFLCVYEALADCIEKSHVITKLENKKIRILMYNNVGGGVTRVHTNTDDSGSKQRTTHTNLVMLKILLLPDKFYNFKVKITICFLVLIYIYNFITTICSTCKVTIVLD